MSLESKIKEEIASLKRIREFYFDAPPVINNAEPLGHKLKYLFIYYSNGKQIISENYIIASSLSHHSDIKWIRTNKLVKSIYYGCLVECSRWSTIDDFRNIGWRTYTWSNCEHDIHHWGQHIDDLPEDEVKNITITRGNWYCEK